MSSERKVREVHLTLPPSYLHQRYVLKSILGSKRKHCQDPNETADKYINHEFPEKVVAIMLEKEAQREIVLPVQTICVLSSNAASFC